MIKPSKYKSIPTKELKAKTITPLTESQKLKANSILEKLVYLIKMKHI